MPKYAEDAAVVVLDLTEIARVLEWCDDEGMYQRWEHYRHHFECHQKRDAFFKELNDLGRAVALARLDGGGYNRPLWSEGIQLRWNDSLMPRELTAPIARLTTLYPGILEGFLPRFFANVAKMYDKGSTHTRAMLILINVCRFGWSAEKHTKQLVQLKIIRPSAYGSEVERVKKFIRDLRSRYRKHVEIMKPYLDRRAARLGTSEAKT